MKYFKMEELVPCFRENGARCRGCRLVQPAMQLPEGVEGNLVSLVEEVLEPVRERLGRPIIVNSGYRCPIHNAAVGGVANSQHLRGEAADLLGKPEALAKAIVANGKWDQLILYPGLTMSTSDATRKSSSELGSSSLLPRFIHVSYKRGGGNRQLILRKTSAGYQKISSSEI